MELLISIILFVFAVLQIILFFKIWGMTNNVKKIVDKLHCDDDKLWAVRRALMAGDKELAKKELLECIVTEFEQRGYSNTLLSHVFTNIVKRYEPAFKQLGMEIPEFFTKVKSAQDIRDIIMLGDD